MTTASEAIARIETEFPVLAEPMHDDINEGLLHLQIGEFGRLAQRFIDAQDRSGFDRVCRLFLELFPKAAPDLENALNVSFLEHLHFEDGKVQRRWAYDAMPEPLRKAWDEMGDYNRQIHGG